MGMALTRIALLLGVVTLASCDSEEPQPLFGPPTESVCPSNSTITYNNFGKSFMDNYCTRCHHTELVGEDRQGAPSFHDFDTLFGIKAVSNHVDFTTAAGPAATNDSMPPGGMIPSDEERRMLGEWIACDMPE